MKTDIYLKRFVIKQPQADAMAQRRIDRLREANAPDDAITEAMLEWKGGNCPKCGKEYKRIHSNNVGERKNHGEIETFTFSDFHYYEAQCRCLEDIEKKREKTDAAKERIADAGLPIEYADTEFYSWDYSVDEGATACMRKALSILEDGDFFSGLGAIFCGTPGRGKTNLGVCMAKWILQNTKKSLIFIPMSSLIGRIIHNGKDSDYETDIMLYDVIFMDDIDKIHSANEWVRMKVFNIIDGMMRAKKQMIITTNFLTIAEFGEKFDKAVESRLVGGCQFILFPEGEDYRILRKLRKLRGEGQKDQTSLF